MARRIGLRTATVHVRPHLNHDGTFCGRFMPAVDGVPLDRWGEATCRVCRDTATTKMKRKV